MEKVDIIKINPYDKMQQIKRICKMSLVYIAYTLPVILFLLPVFLLISRSFFSTQEITSIGAGVFPKQFHPETYRDVLQNTEFIRGLKNTLIVVVCNVIGVPLTAFMAAYAFVKIPFVGKKVRRSISRSKSLIKSAIYQGNIFE